MTLTEKLKRMRDALADIDNLRVYHYWRPKIEPPFCVWAEDSEELSAWSSNKKAEQQLTGYVDFYTLEELDETVDAIQAALDGLEHCGWELDSVQYEEETNLIHYSWRWNIA